MAALLPALLPLGRGPAGLLVWTAVGGLGFVAGTVEGHERHARRVATAPQPWEPATAVTRRGTAVLRITGWPRPGRDRRWTAPALLLAWEVADSNGAVLQQAGAGTGLLVAGKGAQPFPGAVLAGRILLKVPPEAALPGGFDYRRYLAGHGLSWLGTLAEYRVVANGGAAAAMGRRILAPARAWLTAAIGRYLPPREAGLATAVLLGARSAGAREISAPFAALGLAHLFAVSGLHVGILLAIVLLPGRLLGAGPRAATLVLWAFLPGYLLLTGLPASVVRAGGMGLLAAQARPLGRQPDALRLLGILYWTGSVLMPRQNLDTGLQLSYLAAGGILLVSRLTGGLRFSRRRLPQAVLAGLAVGCAAQWFTLPVVAGSFGRISALSPLANLLTVPLFGLAVWSVVLAVAFGALWQPLGQSLGAWAWLLLRGIAGGVEWTARGSRGLAIGLPVPGPPQVGLWLLLTALLLVGLHYGRHWRGRWWLATGFWLGLPVLLLLGMGPGARQLPPATGVVAWQCDVGQGDCGVLSFPDGWTAIIDTGGRFGHGAGPGEGPLARSVLPYLERQGCRQIDAVVLTHGHLDHTGGAVAVARTLEVRKWYVSGRAARALRGEVVSLRIHHPVAGDILHSWGEWSLTVEYPAAGQQQASSENNWSIVCALRRQGRARMVWSGDLELAGEAALLAAQPHLAGIQVWKAGHHGSNTSGSPQLLGLLRPQRVLISCGVENSYHHPSHGPYVVERDTVPILRTDLQGSVRLHWSAAGKLDWQTHRSSGEIGGPP